MSVGQCSGIRSFFEGSFASGSSSQILLEERVEAIGVAAIGDQSGSASHTSKLVEEKVEICKAQKTKEGLQKRVNVLKISELGRERIYLIGKHLAEGGEAFVRSLRLLEKEEEPSNCSKTVEIDGVIYHPDSNKLVMRIQPLQPDEAAIFARYAESLHQKVCRAAPDAVVPHLDAGTVPLKDRCGYFSIMPRASMDLFDYIHKEEISMEEKIAIADQLIDALSCIHRQNIVLLDIKLENVLMYPEGPKWTDLGLAKDLNLYKEVCDKVRAGEPLSEVEELIFILGSSPKNGNIRSAPPEVYTDELFDCFRERCVPEKEARGTSHDVFSMGVFLWNLAEKTYPSSLSKRARNPYADQNHLHLMQIPQEKHEKMISWVLLNESLKSNPLILTALCALNPNPEQRPKDAGELKEIWLKALENPNEVTLFCEET
jgi:serine/threonine protein kinase